MLGKLLKYEFKATGRFIGIMYLAVLVVAAVSGFLGRSAIYEISDRSEMAFVIFMMIYVFLIFATILVTLVMIVERFYKNLLKGEGYLMHTLPVPTWMHVASKTISAFLWEVIAVAVLILSLVLFISAGGIWKDFAIVFNSDFYEFIGQYRITEIVFILCLFVQLIRIVLMFYASMSIGASATKYKVFFSILAFVAIVIIINVIDVAANSGLIQDLIITADGTEFNGWSDWFFAAVLGKQILVDAIYSAVFFVISTFFLKRKLNLE